MTDTVANQPVDSLDPAALLSGDVTYDKLEAFRRATFQIGRAHV